MTQPISIIIPAHNEENVIAATLLELLPGILDHSVETIVVCNGCIDNTAQIAASIDPSIICIETPLASKPNALNLGDRAARWFPRIYLDADVTISRDAVDKIAQALSKGTFMVAAPSLRMGYHDASYLVRSYYDIWQRLPYVKEGMIGVGVYALSEQGRKKFDVFPDIIADDGYIRALFNQNERAIVTNCWSLVRAPQNLKGLVKIKTRSRRGRYELAQKFPELMRNENKEYGKAFLNLVRSPSLWPKVAIYLYVNMASRLYARILPGGITNGHWERDESSREVFARGKKKNREVSQ